MTALKVYKGTRGPRATQKWEPKKWKPGYDIIVSLWVTGKYTQGDIAKFVNKTVIMVNILLNSELAKPYIAKATKKMTENVSTDFKTRLEQIAERSMAIVEKVMNDDVLVEKHPLAMLKHSVDMLKATQKIVEPDGGKKGYQTEYDKLNIHGNVFIVPADQAQRISDGLDKLEEIKRIHGDTRRPDQLVIGPGSVEGK